MKLFEANKDEENVHMLKSTIDEIQLTGSLTHQYQNSSKLAIHDFDDLINETKEFKMLQLENLNKLEETLPNPTGKDFHLQYYQDMEQYELDCVKALKLRIKQLIIVIIQNLIFPFLTSFQRNKKKSSQLSAYINRIQSLDTAFATIKMQTSNDNLDDIISSLRRFHDKNNEMSKKQFSLANEVDLLQQKIDKDRDSLVDIMARLGKTNEEVAVDKDAQLTRDIAMKRTKNE